MFIFEGERFPTAFECKLSASKPGEFDGYGSVFNKIDGHDDIIKPDAFKETLKEHIDRGTRPSMHAMHSLYMGGDMLPVGVWKDVAEDSKGLAVSGKLSALDSDTGKRMYGLMQDNGINGLSIVFRVPEDGATFKSLDDEKGTLVRVIHKMKLRGVDLVDQPSQHLARVTEMRAAWSKGLHELILTPEFRAMMAQGDSAAACAAIVKAADLHQTSTSGGNSPTTDQRLQMMEHLNDAHKAASGGKSLPGMKFKPGSIREFEDFLHRFLGFSLNEARQLSAGGYKSAFPAPRDEGSDRAALSDLKLALSGFKLD